MAKPSYRLIDVLRETSGRLENGDYYQWSHQGSCNCGHLAQTITRLSQSEIHSVALEKAGNWEEKTIDFCKSSGYTIDHIIASMLELGLTTEDIAKLEKLACPEILALIPVSSLPLSHNLKADVILYMKTWADMLENCLIKEFKNNQERLNETHHNFCLIK